MLSHKIVVSADEKNILLDTLASERISIVQGQKENPDLGSYLKDIEKLQEKLIAA